MLSKNLKAQSISINTIIVAIIALLVLVVIVFIFANKSREFVTTTEQCTSVGGSCPDTYGDNGECIGGLAHPSVMCPDQKPCCITLIDNG